MRLKEMPFWNKPGFKLSKGKKPDAAELLAIILEKGINLNESSIELANKLLGRYKRHQKALLHSYICLVTY
jgi:DNA repair protein RadC